MNKYLPRAGWRRHTFELTLACCRQVIEPNLSLPLDTTFEGCVAIIAQKEIGTCPQVPIEGLSSTCSKW